MINEILLKATNIYTETQISVAVLFGAIVQIIMGKHKNLKLILSISVSSVFVAMYVVSPAIEYLHIKEESKIAIAFYALSSLLSVEIMGVIQTFLPHKLKDKISNLIGSRDDDR